MLRLPLITSKWCLCVGGFFHCDVVFEAKIKLFGVAKNGVGAKGVLTTGAAWMGSQKAFSQKFNSKKKNYANYHK